jgi:branched-chain amino acid transport system permease protein
MVGQIIAYGIMIGALYGLIAVGLALIFGVMKYINIAHGSLIITGGYISFWLFSLWHIDPFVSIPVSMLAMFLVGLIVYRLLFSPLSRFSEGERLNNSLLITFGLTLVLDNINALLWDTDSRTISTSYSGMVVDLVGVRLPLTRLAVFGVTFILIAALHLFLNRTHFGKSVRAITEDWEGASLVGINIGRTYILSCGLSTAFAGAAGIPLVLIYSVSPYDGLEWMLMAMVILVLAGLGNIWEVFIAGVLLGVLEQVSVFFVGGQYRAVVGLLIFVLILLLRPEGLFKR